MDLERVQMIASKIILQDNYESYQQALNVLNLETLSVRREALCLKFAKKFVVHEKAKELFPLNNKKRNEDKFKVQFASTGRLMKSSILQLQRMLNEDARK